MQVDEALQKTAQILTNSSLKANNQLLDFQSVGDLQKILNLDKQTPSQDWEALFAWVEQYLQYSPYTAHPNFANRMWSGANIPSMIGEIVTAFGNTSNCTFESAPVAALMEEYMIAQMLDIVGFERGEGQMTTGSSNANMIAMMVARNQALQNVKRQGLFAQKPLFACVSADAHYSLDKAANILGIGTDNLLKIPTLDNGKMNTQALEHTITETEKQGGTVFFVCATLGTTVRGAYDDINDLSALKNQHHFWLHGDGAWGGAAIMSKKLSARFLTGLEKLDSFTMDFHKMLGSNLMCNFLLLNHQNLLSFTCADGDVSYIFRDDKVDLGVNSLQCGRRVDSLKWFLDWKFYTRQGFGDRVENYYKLAQFCEDFINKNPQLELLAQRTSFNVCFRFKTQQVDKNDFTQRLRNALHQHQHALLALAYIGQDLVFRLLFSNVNLDKTKLTTLFERLIITGNTFDV